MLSVSQLLDFVNSKIRNGEQTGGLYKTFKETTMIAVMQYCDGFGTDYEAD